MRRNNVGQDIAAARGPGLGALRWSHRLLIQVCGLALLLTAGGAVAAAQDLAVAAASDLQAVFPHLAERYQRESGRRLRLTFGSSGQFFAQIQNGAPFDLFFSADIDYPRQLAAAGLADADSLHTYAVGRLVVWARRDRGLDLRGGLSTLTAASVRRIAIANPQHAPYGRAAVSALQHAGLYDQLRPKLVLGENVSQAAQFVESGNADAGIVALSVALGPALRASGVYAEIPPQSYPPIEQAAVVVAASRAKVAARELLAFIRRQPIVDLLAEFGFSRPR